MYRGNMNTPSPLAPSIHHWVDRAKASPKSSLCGMPSPSISKAALGFSTLDSPAVRRLIQGSRNASLGDESIRDRSKL